MDIYDEIELQGCPYCGGAGLLDDGSGWCWTVTCMDCGSQTGEFEYGNDEERTGEFEYGNDEERKEAAKKAAYVWNIGKVIRSDLSE